MTRGWPGHVAMMAGLPEYVSYGGLTTCPSPVNCTGSTLYAFFLSGDHACLRDLCTRVFGSPSSGAVEIRPALSQVMLTFGEVEKIEPQMPPWSQMGYATERQVALWIPAVRIRNLVPVQLGWFVPYMLVDNPLSLCGGREIYGFNKAWGWIGLPREGAAAPFTLAAYGGDYDGNEPAGKHDLLSVTGPASTLSVADEAPLSGLEDVVAAVQGALTSPGPALADSVHFELAGTVFEQILRLGGPPQFYLRQFRSIEDGLESDPQQITSSAITLKRIEVRRLSGAYAFALNHLDSHPIGAELGVEDQSPYLALEMKSDFVLENGTVLWQA